jgi:hypothetical protein
MKVFSGSEIISNGFKRKIEAIGVDTVMKDNIQSRLAGFKLRFYCGFHTRN